MAAEGMPPSILIGHSFGGAASLAGAARVPSVRAVATVGAPFDAAHVLEQIGKESLAEIEQSGEADVRLGGRQLRFGRSFIDDVRQQDQAARIGDLGRALLVLHAPGDEVVGIMHAGKIFTAAKHPKSFVSLDKADHLLTRHVDAEYVGGVIASWVSRYLPVFGDEQRS
jgi:putative redox protein